MLRVQVYLEISKIHGVGVFAAEKIKKGQLIWEFDGILDSRFTADYVQTMSFKHQNFIYHYGFLSKATKCWILCGDHARFMNHAEFANTMSVPFIQSSLQVLSSPIIQYDEDVDIACDDIEPGEELTCNYFEFDDHEKLLS